MDRNRVYGWNLVQKERESKLVIAKALERFGKDKIAAAFTGGKDSLVVLHLLKQVGDGQVPIPVLHIDTSVKFKEIYEYRDKLVKEWNLNLIVTRNEQALKEIRVAQDREVCCQRLKTDALNMAIIKHGWRALITGVRWDEQEARAREKYFSPRVHHTRIHPILHFREQDIWEYIRKYELPYCPLYDQGYRSIGCEPCTKPAKEGFPERGGRAQDKEEIMERLRALGYF